jgi:CheY-like chemotaxis protein
MADTCILVVDDEPGIADLIGDFCEGMGYSVRTVTDSRDALREAKAIKPCLITLDLQMPNVDGFELLRQFKADPETEGIPVIIVSVLAREVERQGLLSAAQAILSKPIDFQTFKKRVDDYAKS